ncbi:MAG TPA: DoxX-like family protein [Silvibacterium sp.]|nr:DoxX-like family protein [Silvibacterium sp.]
MTYVALAFPPLLLIRISIAAVWLYEGVWCKLLGRLPSQAEVVAAVPRLGPRFGKAFLKLLGIVEAGLALWVLSGVAPAMCAIAQVILLFSLNLNGLIWARRRIHDPGGMVVKNAAFLVLVWIAGAFPQSKP